jgi:predicted metalloprotease with PDZ domain
VHVRQKYYLGLKEMQIYICPTLFFMQTIIKLFTAMCFMAFTGKLLATNGYAITVDLNNVVKDKVKVVCNVPDIKESEVVFVFPSVIPGSYALKEYGRYIEGFKAYGADGKALKVKKADKFNYTVSNATQLKRVEYYVNDTWEEKSANNFIFQPGGSNIAADKNFVVNPFAFFGYAEGYKNKAYNITFQKPDNLEGYSYLSKTSSKGTDVFTASDYDFLADNPILYCKPNSSVFNVGHSKVHVCVYSETGKVDADSVAEYLKPIGHALEKFFGNLPVDDYYFLFYFDKPENLPQKKSFGLSSGTGALEHNHCSFYYLLETGSVSDMKAMLNEVCSHEFLHILTPLNLHSKEVADFNFRYPVMSQHLWMYEGVTEYFAGLAQLQDSMFTLDEYMKNMRSKVFQSEEFDNFSFTDMSKNVITKENQKRYLSVYSRGALLAMMLDWTIIEATDGAKDLKQTMFELAKMYGTEKPFNDEELINKFVELTSPQVKTFFDNYITGKEQPPMAAEFEKIGWEYKNEYEQHGYYFGKMGLAYNTQKNEFTFYRAETNTLGVKQGDVLLSVNGTPLTIENAEAIVGSVFYENTKGGDVTLKVRRGTTEMELSGKPVEATRKVKNYIAPSSDAPSDKQKMILNKWLNG